MGFCPSPWWAVGCVIVDPPAIKRGGAEPHVVEMRTSTISVNELGKGYLGNSIIISRMFQIRQLYAYSFFYKKTSLHLQVKIVFDITHLQVRQDPEVNEPSRMNPVPIKVSTQPRQSHHNRTQSRSQSPRVRCRGEGEADSNWPS